MELIPDNRISAWTHRFSLGAFRDGLARHFQLGCEILANGTSVLARAGVSFDQGSSLILLPFVWARASKFLLALGRRATAYRVYRHKASITIQCFAEGRATTHMPLGDRFSDKFAFTWKHWQCPEQR